MSDLSWRSVHVFACIVWFSTRECNLPAALFVWLVMNVLTDWNAAKRCFMLSLLLGVLGGHAGQSEKEQCVAKSSSSGVKTRMGVQALSFS